MEFFNKIIICCLGLLVFTNSNSANVIVANFLDYFIQKNTVPDKHYWFSNQLPQLVKAADNNVTSLNELKQYNISNQLIDYLAYEFCKYCNYAFLYFLFPIVKKQKQDQVEALMKKYGTIIYKKDIWLKNNGPCELIAQIPTKTIKMTSSYFPQDNLHPLTVYLYFCQQGKRQVLSCKERIRKLYQPPSQYGLRHINHAIHSTDTQQENLLITGTIFNENSINFINNKSHDTGFLDQVLALKKYVVQNNIRIDSFCFVGNTTKAVLQGQQHSPWTYVEKEENTKSLKEVLPILLKKISTQMSNELINNPAKHFYYCGFKFALP